MESTAADALSVKERCGQLILDLSGPAADIDAILSDISKLIGKSKPLGDVVWSELRPLLCVRRQDFSPLHFPKLSRTGVNDLLMCTECPHTPSSW